MENPDERTIQLSASSLHSLAACPERYEIKALIGQGGMGMVFRALDTQLNRDVAIKVLLFENARGKTSQERFLREAKALAVLDHPNIVRIFSSGLNDEGNPYNVMEFLEGESLSQVLSRGPLNAASFFELFSQVLSGIEHAHQQQIVHRDLKPSNIMHCKTLDGSAVYKIIDFGIARIDLGQEKEGKTLTGTGKILGSPIYISPEQCRGERGDNQSDIYSLGCIMYECISGKPPFQGETSIETMYKHMTETPVSLEVQTKSLRSKQLAHLIAGCLEKKPEDRPRLSEIASEFQQILSATDINRIDLFRNQDKSIKDNNRFRITGGLVAILTVAIATGSALHFYRRSAKPEAIKIDSPQDRITHDIASQEMRIARWKNPSLPIRGSIQRERYLDDLFLLGRSPHAVNSQARSC